MTDSVNDANKRVIFLPFIDGYKALIQAEMMAETPEDWVKVQGMLETLSINLKEFWNEEYTKTSGKEEKIRRLIMNDQRMGLDDFFEEFKTSIRTQSGSLLELMYKLLPENVTIE